MEGLMNLRVADWPNAIERDAFKTEPGSTEEQSIRTHYWVQNGKAPRTYSFNSNSLEYAQSFIFHLAPQKKVRIQRLPVFVQFVSPPRITNWRSRILCQTCNHVWLLLHKWIEFTVDLCHVSFCMLGDIHAFLACANFSSFQLEPSTWSIMFNHPWDVSDSLSYVDIPNGIVHGSRLRVSCKLWYRPARVFFVYFCRLYTIFTLTCCHCLCATMDCRFLKSMLWSYRWYA